jgi:hypothetical protein
MPYATTAPRSGLEFSSAWNHFLQFLLVRIILECLTLGCLAKAKTFLILAASPSPSPVAATAACPHTPPFDGRCFHQALSARALLASTISFGKSLLAPTVPLAAPIIAVSAGHRLVPFRRIAFLRSKSAPQYISTLVRPNAALRAEDGFASRSGSAWNSIRQLSDSDGVDNDPGDLFAPPVCINFLFSHTSRHHFSKHRGLNELTAEG